MNKTKEAENSVRRESPDRNAITAILHFLKPHPWTLPLLVVLGLVGSLAESIGIGLIIPLLTHILHQGVDASASNLAILARIDAVLRPFSVTQAILLIAFAMVSLISVRALVMFMAARLSTRIVGGINDDIRQTLFRQLLEGPYALVSSSARGRLLSAFDIQTWRAMEAMLSLCDLLTTVCSAAVIVVFLCIISLRLTAVVMILGGVAGVAVWRRMTRRLDELGQRATTASAEMSQSVITVLDGMRAVRAFGREAHELSRFGGVSERAADVYALMNLSQRIASPLLELLYVPVLLAGVVAAQWLSIAVPVLLAFLILFYRLQPQMRSIIHDAVFVLTAAGAVKDIAELLDQTASGDLATEGKKFSGLKRSVTFRNVTFSYQSDDVARLALSEISFELQANRMTAIVGRSGAGKTTVINLLYRFLEPSQGEILVDGLALKSVELSSWRARLALAGQDATLVGGTIFDNIAYGKPDAGMAAVIEAARSVSIHDFIESLPLGYQTDVGDRGHKLSEGQRQRIGLARALLRDPDVLILDEATNALDGLTESVVHQTLDRLTHRKTLIVIAHRLSTIRKADHVVVLSEGRVMEQGSPSDLLASAGVFAELHSAQIE